MPDDLPQIIGYALACSLPVLVAGALALRRLRDRSPAVSTAVLVLVPTLATLAGITGVSGLMFTAEFRRIALVPVLVAAVTVPAAVLLSREQARRTVRERRIRARERAAERSRRDLVAWASHDLRTPLAEIRALTAALSGGMASGPGDIARYAEQIDRETRRLSRMAHDLVEMAEISAGTPRPDLGPLDLRELSGPRQAHRGAIPAADPEPDRRFEIRQPADSG